MKEIIRNLLPPIKVHIWGGFGSQLFALIAAQRLNRKFPHRNITMVFHSSGVTKRHREIPLAFLNAFTILEVDDFSESILLESSQSQSVNLRIREIRKLVRDFLARIGCIADLDFDDNLNQTKPWLLQTRGHYSYIKLTPGEVLEVCKVLGISDTSLSNQLEQSFYIHLRLGDLLNLQTKTHTPVERFLSVLEKQGDKLPIKVYSDSDPEIVLSIIGANFSPEVLSIGSTNVFETILMGVCSEKFLGTSSKISIWISVIREYFQIGSLTAIPFELYDYVCRLLPNTDIDNSRLLKY